MASSSDGGKRLYIVNPAARGASGRPGADGIAAQIPLRAGVDQICFTRAPGDAEDLAASAIDFGTVVAVGGDGTVSEVLSGIMRHPEPRPRLAIVPGGTGNDIARAVGIDSVPDALTAVQSGSTGHHDLLQVDYVMPEGGIGTRYGFLFSSAGFSANAMTKPWMKRWLPPAVAYYLGTLLAIFPFRPPIMAVSSEGTRHEGVTWVVIAANAERIGGGGMCIAPGATTDDGEIQVTIVPGHSKWEVCTRLLPGVRTGAHLAEPGVVHFSAGELAISSDPPSTVEIDGDVVGLTPATITLQPGALEVLGCRRDP